MRKINTPLLQVFTFVLLLVADFTFAQDAKAYLEEVAETAKSYDNIYIEFEYKLDNTAADIHQETTGSATLQQDLYRFNYMGVDRFFDGSKIYTILHEDEEVVITNPTINEEEAIITPSNILTFYEKGFTYKMDIVQNMKSKKIQFVKLTPIDSNTELKYVHIGVDSNTNHIYKVIQTGLDDTVTTITVSKIETNQTLSQQLFTFDKNKFEADGYYISEPK
jgi:outer membrane lipoprotein-sorting protein